MQVTNNPKMALIILDGWGDASPSKHNAIHLANTPNWHNLIQSCPNILLEASGQSVGLPTGQMGNSEVGHLTLGAGRSIDQDLSRIDKSFAKNEFASLAICQQLIKQCKSSTAYLHIMGLLSPGGVHAHEEHLFQTLRVLAAAGLKKIALHCILDGRDTPPKSASESINKLENLCQELGVGHIASIQGRFYAMDRDKRWERTQAAYDLLTQSQCRNSFASAELALAAAYAKGLSDEFVEPSRIEGLAGSTLEANDSVLFTNFRSDRARQITEALTGAEFKGFPRLNRPMPLHFYSFTQYADDYGFPVFFPKLIHQNTLGAYLSNLSYRQLRIAETEKYAHVTYFFNGGVEAAYPLEERCLLPSKKVKTFDSCPEMSAKEISEALIQAIQAGQADLIVCNFANADMLGHTGNLAQTIKACEIIDQCLGEIVLALRASPYQALITADHGNAEIMFDEQTQQFHTAHTANKVPLIYIGDPNKSFKASSADSLSDVAPTILACMNQAIPSEMSGRNLFSKST